MMNAKVPFGVAYFPVQGIHATRDYAFLLLDQFTLLAFGAALEPLRIANQLAQKPLYCTRTLSEGGAAVQSSSGVLLQVDGALDDLPPDTTLVVCAGAMNGTPATARTLARISRHLRFGGTVIGICTGAITLARAGVLTGKRFTLHWENQPAFRERFFGLTPTERKFEKDGKVLTSGGGAAATDLMMSLIGDDFGDDFVLMVADMCLHRADTVAGTTQRSSLGASIGCRNPSVVNAVKMMQANIEAPLSVDAIASLQAVSRRQLERLFKEHLGVSPGQCYRNLRLDHGRSLLLETDLAIREIALACGFAASDHFASLFRARFGTPPSKMLSLRRRDAVAA